MRMRRVTWMNRAAVVSPVALLSVMVLAALPGLAQQGNQGGSQGGNTPTTGSTGGTTPRGGPGPTQPNRTPSQSSPQIPQVQQPILISGTVQMYDGSPTPHDVVIERVCGANSVRAEDHTDSNGGFSFQLGNNFSTVFDASSNNSFGTGAFGNPAGLDPSSPFGGAQTSTFPTGTEYWNCEIRANLGGYRSTSISLAGRRPMDNPNIGTIILYPLAKIDGISVSATTALAPKNARKAFEKGVEEATKGKLDKAEKELLKAVELYPKHAEAWFTLGKVYESTDRKDEARQAYQSALTADPQFVFPYERLYQLAYLRQDWPEVVEMSDQLLRLNPYEFPKAYYFNGVGHYNLKDFDEAEKSARQAIEADQRGQYPRNRMLLAWTLLQKQELREAAENFQVYLQTDVPEEQERADIESILAQIDEALAGR